MAANWFERTYKLLANMGLVLRDDPPKVIDITSRVWGDAVNGLTLSIRELPRDDDGRVAGISIVIRNSSADSKTLNGPLGAFYRVEGLTPSAYGLRLAGASGDVTTTPVTLRPGDAIENDLPVATMYDINSPGSYTLHISRELPGNKTLRSNELTLRI